MNALGFDISRYQGEVDFEKAKSKGINFSICRATVGDYYSDPNIEENWRGGEEVIQLGSAYLVVAPATVDGRKITADAHLKLFQDTMKGKQPTLKRWWVDSELVRGQTKDYITGITKDIVNGLWQMTGLPPVIYTRQNIWDYNVKPDPLWGMCDLHAARYSSYLTSPWSDGLYRFRDWDSWTFWQYTSKAYAPNYGAEGKELDLDYFNGTATDLLNYAEMDIPKVGLYQWADVITSWARKNGYTGPDLDPYSP